MILHKITIIAEGRGIIILVNFYNTLEHLHSIVSVLSQGLIVSVR
jgi:hypothetical protein